MRAHGAPKGPEYRAPRVHRSYSSMQHSASPSEATLCQKRCPRRSRSSEKGDEVLQTKAGRSQAESREEIIPSQFELPDRPTQLKAAARVVGTNQRRMSHMHGIPFLAKHQRTIDENEQFLNSSIRKWPIKDGTFNEDFPLNDPFG